MAGYSRNINLLYLYSSLVKRVSQPIIILYFLLNHLNFTQIGILAATIQILTVTMEVHGGVFTDLYGKRLSLLLHASLGFLTMFLYFIGDSFWHFLIASILYGASGTFISGTREAYLYDLLKEAEHSNLFKKFMGRMVLISHSFSAVVLLCIPYLYNLNTKLPFLIGMVFFFIAAILSCLMTEVPVEKPRNNSLKQYNQKISESIKEIRETRELWYYASLFLLIGPLGWMLAEYVQPLLTRSGLPVIYLGIVYCLMRVVTGFGSEFTEWLEQKIHKDILSVSIAIGILCLFVLSVLGNFYLIILFILIIKFVEGITKVSISDSINQIIGSKNRTTVLSSLNLLRALLASFVVFVAGLAADAFGIQTMLFLSFFVFLGSLVISQFIKMKVKKES